MRSTIMAAVLAISTLFAAAPAMASENGAHANGAQYPVAAATFQQKIQTREAKAREHMEKRVATMNAEQAAQVRAKFDAKMAKVDAEVAKAVADGTVTKQEAKEVRQAMGGHHGKKGGEKRAARSGERGRVPVKQG